VRATEVDDARSGLACLVDEAAAESERCRDEAHLHSAESVGSMASVSEMQSTSSPGSPRREENRFFQRVLFIVQGDDELRAEGSSGSDDGDHLAPLSHAARQTAPLRVPLRMIIGLRFA